MTAKYIAWLDRTRNVQRRFAAEHAFDASICTQPGCDERPLSVTRHHSRGSISKRTSNSGHGHGDESGAMLPIIIHRLLARLACVFGGASGISSQVNIGQNRLGDDFSQQGASPSFFAGLERLARLVDISYCVGTTGLAPPFNCASRCQDFPSLKLEATWNTGMLMSDSCGYIAVDAGSAIVSPTSNCSGDQGAIIVAFRGTYSLTNTIVDLSTVPQEYVPYPGDGEDSEPAGLNKPESATSNTSNCVLCHDCTVHMGFYESWRQARKVVLPVLRSLHEQYPTYQLQLVGHSLGGAVAALAALEMKVSLGWQDLVVTTFGEPQLGNAGFVDYLNQVFDVAHDDGYDKDLEKRTYRRVTHIQDPVPLLPLSEWGFRSHAGEAFLSKQDLPQSVSDMRLCRGNADPRCVAGQQDGRLLLWQLLFAHRDYFWRLGLCVPQVAWDAQGTPEWDVDEI